jgi:hypothetical protein
MMKKFTQHVAYWSLTLGVPVLIILTILIQLKEIIYG